MIINEDFIPKRQGSNRLPPGQYEERGFPVLSLGPTPQVAPADWKLDVIGLVEKPLSWNWEQFNALQKTQKKADIHCVTKWSKFDTNWDGIPLDMILALAVIKDTATTLIAHSYDGYSTNLPLKDVSGAQAIVATSYEGSPIESKHGGPARLLVPHLYFWKSAKWLKQLELADHDKPGFWETRGYHNYGDPWKEQRYTND